MVTTKVKICGIKDRDTIDLCHSLNVDFIGLNFSKASPRSIHPSDVPNLFANRTAEGFPKVVFLFFQNEVLEIEEIVTKFKPDLIQLIAGDPVDITSVWDKYKGEKTLLPAFRLQGAVGDESLLCPELPLVILDSYKRELGGGTGHTFPWEYVKKVKRPYLLAGGITPDNVEEAVRYLHPFGIDVASGVETNGQKDHHKIRELIKNARRD